MLNVLSPCTNVNPPDCGAEDVPRSVRTVALNREVKDSSGDPRQLCVEHDFTPNVDDIDIRRCPRQALETGAGVAWEFCLNRLNIMSCVELGLHTYELDLIPSAEELPHASPRVTCCTHPSLKIEDR